MADLLLEILFNLIGVVVEAFVERYASNDTAGWRIFWGIVLVVIGGVVWWELAN